MATPNLSKSLSDRANILTNKANNAQTIFGPIITLLDNYLSFNEVLSLSTKSRKLLIALCLDFKATIERHFDALITGHHPPPPELIRFLVLLLLSLFLSLPLLLLVQAPQLQMQLSKPLTLKKPLALPNLQHLSKQ
ncbi:hypothetical protein OCU04_003857 [Sclerotinia nivalis]|uniref:Uncharacterized protein n=1 Tax=Sclerotinia nivalis TaxID=352851 RepID=A0A9X0ASW5_9HELO|nr:hypothetical protein OCU04_003857 [Sclerotinia nivalis]